MNCYKTFSPWPGNGTATRTAAQARRLLSALLEGDAIEIDGELRRTEEVCRLHPRTTLEMEELEALEGAAEELRKTAIFEQRKWPGHSSTAGAVRLLEILANDRSPARSAPY
jgi:hypothetical protein